jgi:hypothetical protein
MALVQRSWCHPAQSELFRTVVLKCPVRAQLFIEAFVRNIGPGNPLWRMGINRVRLESLVRHIYVDIPENYTQGQFYGNLVTIFPLLSNLRSLYLVMRRWNDHIWDVELGKFIPEHAPRSLERLSIEVSKYYRASTPVCLRSHSRSQQAIQVLYCSHVGRISAGGGVGLVHGSTSGRWPSSAKTFGGTDQLICPYLNRPKQPFRSSVAGWLARRRR